jgi:RNA polymerase sigma factor for flagellar operon FliA
MLPNPRVNTEDLPNQEREWLILKHLPQVRLLARKIHNRLPENVSLEDLVSTGVVGLISAVDRFDPSRHVSLGSYAEHKITGGMLDSLRRLDWASRLLRKRAKQMEAAFAVVEQRLQRAPTEQELARELNITVDRYRRWQTDVSGLNVLALEAPETEDSEKWDRLPSIPGDPSQLPSAVFERRELQRALAAAISELPEKHQAILSMYYRDGLTLKEIGKIVGVHESRIYQIRSQAVKQLRACMAKLWPNGRCRHSPN